ncbi:Vmc-like lipoprotein signal peptide domain-containing protein [Mycoplasma corogypsi]|uniref:Vmc-like lipoprotein signal peptide domain-containing protein n=1 Tax=Mycoplasma corogypsi TaxID=2106 RepID=UPI003872CA63
MKKKFLFLLTSVTATFPLVSIAAACGEESKKEESADKKETDKKVENESAKESEKASEMKPTTPNTPSPEELERRAKVEAQASLDAVLSGKADTLANFSSDVSAYAAIRTALENAYAEATKVKDNASSTSEQLKQAEQKLTETVNAQYTERAKKAVDAYLSQPTNHNNIPNLSLLPDGTQALKDEAVNPVSKRFKSQIHWDFKTGNIYVEKADKSKVFIINTDTKKYGVAFVQFDRLKTRNNKPFNHISLAYDEGNKTGTAKIKIMPYVESENVYEEGVSPKTYTLTFKLGDSPSLTVTASE